MSSFDITLRRDTNERRDRALGLQHLAQDAIHPKTDDQSILKGST